jgi:hypothetical protein
VDIFFPATARKMRPEEVLRKNQYPSVSLEGIIHKLPYSKNMVLKELTPQKDIDKEGRESLYPHPPPPPRHDSHEKIWGSGRGGG